MKKLLFLLLPLFAFGQIIVDKEHGKIDIRDFKDEYIKVYIYKTILPASHLLTTTEFKEIVMMAPARNKKRMNVYDGNELISLRYDVDVLNFFSKYGFEYLGTTIKNEGSISIGNNPYEIADTSSSITFRNNNN